MERIRGGVPIGRVMEMIVVDIYRPWPIATVLHCPIVVIHLEIINIEDSALAAFDADCVAQVMQVAVMDAQGPRRAGGPIWILKSKISRRNAVGGLAGLTMTI